MIVLFLILTVLSGVLFHIMLGIALAEMYTGCKLYGKAMFVTLSISGIIFLSFLMAFLSSGTP